MEEENDDALPEDEAMDVNDDDEIVASEVPDVWVHSLFQQNNTSHFFQRILPETSFTTHPFLAFFIFPFFFPVLIRRTYIPFFPNWNK